MSHQNITANSYASSKQSKRRKKNAILFLDQLVLQRLSEYFTCWKLKVLLGQSFPATQAGESGINREGGKKWPQKPPCIEEFSNDNDELQLDFSTWHKEIQADELERKIKNPLRSQVKVHKVSSSGQKSMDHLRPSPQDEAKAPEDLLDNYTFDLTLGDESDLAASLGDIELFLSGHDHPFQVNQEVAHVTRPVRELARD